LGNQALLLLGVVDLQIKPFVELIRGGEYVREKEIQQRPELVKVVLKEKGREGGREGETSQSPPSAPKQGGREGGREGREARRIRVYIYLQGSARDEQPMGRAQHPHSLGELRGLILEPVGFVND